MMSRMSRTLRITLLSVLASAALAGGGYVLHADHSYTKQKATLPAANPMNTTVSIAEAPANPEPTNSMSPAKPEQSASVSSANLEQSASVSPAIPEESILVSSAIPEQSVSPTPVNPEQVSSPKEPIVPGKETGSVVESASTPPPVGLASDDSTKAAAVTTVKAPAPSKAAIDDPVPNEKNVNLNQTQINQVKTQLESGSLADEPAWQRESDAIIAAGMKYLGTPYVYGAKIGQTSNFDCSSFMKYIFSTQGIKLPRDSRQQSQVGTQVSLDQLRPGDLLFFTTPARKSLTGVDHIGHVAVYIGNGLILHTFRPGIGVTVSKLQGSWVQRFVEAKRVIT